MSDNNGNTTLPAVVQQYSIMTMDHQDLAEVLRDNTAGQLSRLDLPTVKIPAGGGTSWTIPDVEEGDRNEKSLRGIVVYQTVVRGYWEQTFEATGGGTPPTCYSNDGRRGVGEPGGDCATCKLNQWGTDPRGGNGKACREMRLIFMIQEHDILPFVVALPPTSVRPAHQFFVGLARKGIGYYAVVTEVGLEQDKSAAGIRYSKATFKMVGKLTPEQVAVVKAYREALIPTLREIRVTAEDAGLVDEGTSEDYMPY